jgi:hypothetical protein
MREEARTPSHELQLEAPHPTNASWRVRERREADPSHELELGWEGVGGGRGARGGGGGAAHKWEFVRCTRRYETGPIPITGLGGCARTTD